MRHRPAELVARVVLALVTLVLLASMGGGFVFVPLLLPLHVWAARRAGPVTRWLWLAMPAAGLGGAAWALTYVAVGESMPAIWLVPVSVLAGAMVVLDRLVVPRRPARA